MPTSAAVRKAVIPAAGLGTRFLPATKAVPKEMLPVVDTPTIQYVVEEAVSAVLGGDDFIHPSDPLLRRLLEVRERYGGSVVTLMEVDREQISLCGAASVEPTGEDDVFR